MNRLDPSWTAPRDGQDWRDDELMLAVTWRKSLVPRRDMERRLDAAKEYLLAARKRQRDGEPASLSEENDSSADHALQMGADAVARTVYLVTGAAALLEQPLSVRGSCA